MGSPIDDDSLVDLADALAGLRRELPGVTISSTVDVDPDQRFGPWTAVLEALRAGATGLDGATAGRLLERSVPAADHLRAAMATATALADDAGREAAVEACTIAAIEDAAALADGFGEDDPALVFAVESACALVLGAAYATWVTRDLVDATAAAGGSGLLDAALRPVAGLHALRKGSAAAVLDVAEVLPPEVWAAMASAAVERPAEEAMAAVRVRALVALAGLGAAEPPVVAALAPAGTEPVVALDAALVVGDAAVATAALEAAVADPEACALARAAWERTTRT